MDEKIFRKKSIERVTSPEELNDYVKVATPSVWIILIIAALVLTALCIWAMLGTIDTVVRTAVEVKNGSATVYLSEKAAGDIKNDVEIYIDDKSFKLINMPDAPILVDSKFDEYIKFIGDFSDGDWVYPVGISGNAEFSDGIYEATVITERISPISFLTN